MSTEQYLLRRQCERVSLVSVVVSGIYEGYLLPVPVAMLVLLPGL